MAKKRKTAPKSRPEHWEISKEHNTKSTTLVPGTEFTFKEFYGIHRRAKFVEKVHNTKNDAIWLNCWELAPDSGSYIAVRFRSIKPDNIRRVHKKAKKSATRKQRLKKRKEN